MGTPLLCIHGGTTFPSHEAYLTYLRTKELTIERLRPYHDWKDGLQEALGEAFEVLAPRMPNGHNAQYDEWALWCGRILELLAGREVLMLGHSLGGMFLARYLAEEALPVRVRATFLVAAPFDDATLGEPLASFTPPHSYADLAAHAGALFLYHSTDDPVVPYDNARRYAALLPHATLRTLEGRGHVNGEDFPELVADVRRYA